MSRILVTLLRTAVSRQIRYECQNSSVHPISHLRILGVSRYLCSKSNEGNGNSDKDKPARKKTKEIPKITLIQQNDAISVTTLEEATKLARRRDLQLIKVTDLDPKSHRPVYKLATVAELLAEEESNDSKSEKTSKKLTVKSLTVGNRIGDNDLASRLKNINKWLSKGCEVRVLIQGTNNDNKSSEAVYQKIEASVKEPQAIGKITQKRSKDGLIKFNIYPLTVEKSHSSAASGKA